MPSSKNDFSFSLPQGGHIFSAKIAVFRAVFAQKIGNPSLILAANPAVNRCQSQSTDFRGAFVNFRGTFANYRGAFGHFCQITGGPLVIFAKLPGGLWQITGGPLVIFGKLPGYLWALPGYLLPTSGVPFAHFRGTFDLLPGYLWPITGVPLVKIRICHEIFRQRYPGNLSFTAVSLLFPHVLTMTTLLDYIGNPQATAWPGWNPVSL